MGFEGGLGERETKRKRKTKGRGRQEQRGDNLLIGT